MERTICSFPYSWSVVKKNKKTGNCDSHSLQALSCAIDAKPLTLEESITVEIWVDGFKEFKAQIECFGNLITGVSSRPQLKHKSASDFDPGMICPRPWR